MRFDGIVSVLALLLPLTRSSQTIFPLKPSIELMSYGVKLRVPAYSLTTMNGRPCSSFITEATIGEG